MAIAQYKWVQMHLQLQATSGGMNWQKKKKSTDIFRLEVN